ncbi:MAG TPA: tetratricopeptide repeat protein [Caldimonas sp.]|jgi:tetratricopeptide (TPR) repeat protein|nr:tetratricopeptide repeat protein [Caldimonas sp.]
MRSASVSSRLAALALLLGAAGCSTVGSSIDAVRDAVTPGTRPAGAAATAAPAAPVRPAPPVYDSPVNPATQRAFDDASRALRSGRVDEAERAYKALAQANPELGGPRANLGVIYRQSGKVNESVVELEQATKLSPRQPIYLNQLGIAYRQQGQFAKSRDAYQRALGLDPGYAAAALNLGILYDLYLGDTARALELYGRYLALMPNGDATVTKWVADLKNRKPGPITVSRQEKP